MEKNKTLLLFTGEFPYGKKGEPFLEDEILFLSKEFSNIYVFPRVKSEKIRPLPTNVQIVDVLVADSFKILKQSVIAIIKSCFCIFFESLKTPKGFRYLVNFRHFLYIRMEAEFLSRKLLNWSKVTNPGNSLAYFYWSDTSLLAYTLLKRTGYTNPMVCRAHGFDLYDNRNLGGLIPFRLTMYKTVDSVYCISNHGKNYLLNILPKKLRLKIKLAYLGVRAPKQITAKNGETHSIIVSCARMEGFKRISLIPEILRLIQTPIHWVHFGEGPEFERVKEQIKQLPPNVKVSLMGQLTNSEIHEFYASKSVRLFISLSLSEGLPVSMMEAISYGIPILSTSVNGTPEIVTPETGILISVNDPIETIAKKIESALMESQFDKERIKDFYFANFNADNNYRKFAKELAECI